MLEYAGRERRKNYRKKYNAAIKLTPKERVNLAGTVLNVNCYGVRIEIRFKSTSPEPIFDAIFCVPSMTLEFADTGDEINFELPAQTKWKKAINADGESIYDVGFALNLGEDQRREWREFYNLLKN